MKTIQIKPINHSGLPKQVKAEVPNFNHQPQHFHFWIFTLTACNAQSFYRLVQCENSQEKNTLESHIQNHSSPLFVDNLKCAIKQTRKDCDEL